MVYRISIFFVSLLLSFSAIASDGSHTSDTDALIGQESQAIETGVDFLPALAVMGEEPVSVGCESEFQAFSGELILAQGCCRVCTVGKACGDSCISRSYTCHQGRGCACNG